MLVSDIPDMLGFCVEDMSCLYCIHDVSVIFVEDVLTEDREDECIICLEELQRGDTIARLPCLCIYHKRWAFRFTHVFT